MPTGIYCIRNIKNNKRYIGYSVDCFHRKSSHFFKLKHDKHSNPKLQNAYNKVGKEDFVFEILEEMPFAKKRQLAKREMEFIVEYDSWKNGYNCNAGGGVNGLSAKKFNWINVHNGSTACASVLEMCGNFNLSSGNLYKVTSGKYPTCGGWALEGSDWKNRWGKRSKNNPFSGKKYHLINESTRQEITGSTRELSLRLKVSEKTLLKSIRKSPAFGWRHFDISKDIPDYEI